MLLIFVSDFQHLLSAQDRSHSITLIRYQCVRVKSLQLCPNLCDPMDCSPLGFSALGILQARTLPWVAMPCPSPGGLPSPGIELASITSPALAGGLFTISATRETQDTDVKIYKRDFYIVSSGRICRRSHD